MQAGDSKEGKGGGGGGGKGGAKKEEGGGKGGKKEEGGGGKGKRKDNQNQNQNKKKEQALERQKKKEEEEEELRQREAEAKAKREEEERLRIEAEVTLLIGTLLPHIHCQAHHVHLTSQEAASKAQKDFEDMKQDAETRVRINKENSAFERPTEAWMRANTKADIKKCPAFVKKLSIVTEDKKAPLVRDFKGLNLTKYIAEGALFHHHHHH